VERFFIGRNSKKETPIEKNVISKKTVPGNNNQIHGQNFPEGGNLDQTNRGGLSLTEEKIKDSGISRCGFAANGVEEEKRQVGTKMNKKKKNRLMRACGDWGALGAKKSRKGTGSERHMKSKKSIKTVTDVMRTRKNEKAGKMGRKCFID